MKRLDEEQSVENELERTTCAAAFFGKKKIGMIFVEFGRFAKPTLGIGGDLGDWSSKLYWFRILEVK